MLQKPAVGRGHQLTSVDSCWCPFTFVDKLVQESPLTSVGRPLTRRQLTPSFLYKNILSQENQTLFCKARKWRKWGLEQTSPTKSENVFKGTDPWLFRSNCQPYILIRTWFYEFLMILTNPKRCGTSVRSFSTHFRAEISVMCQKTKVSVLWKRLFFTFKPGSDVPARCLRRTPHRKCVFFLKPGCDALAGCLRRTPHRKLTFF